MPDQPRARRSRKKRLTLAEALVILGILGALVIPRLDRSGERSKSGATGATGDSAASEEGPNAVELPGEPAGFDDDRAAHSAPSLAARLQVLGFIATAIVVTSLIARELLRRRRR